MACQLEYHKSVNRWSLALVAGFGLLALSAAGYAQINGTPSSVTSPGFGGHAVNGTAPSVTSLGPHGYGQGPVTQFRSDVPRSDGPRHEHTGDQAHHRRHGGSSQGEVYLWPVPLYFDGSGPQQSAAPQEQAEEDDDADYQGGPTVFDRRGRGEQDYVPPVKDVPQAHWPDAPSARTPETSVPVEPTVLVFKDGRKQEVSNYAIVDKTLYDVSAGRAHKIALADLDLEATQKVNDERGVTFQVPLPAKAN